LIETKALPGPRVRTDQTLPGPARADCGNVHRYFFRHLTLAAEELACEGDPAGRYAVVAARFRDMGYGPLREDIGPFVVLEDGTVARLSELLAAAWVPERGTFPGRHIDAELLAEARRLLGLAWQLPDL
jgi:hypothetical protein